MRLEGKVAIVTGAGSGIGRTTALLFAREGAKVIGATDRADDLRPLEQAAEGLAGTVAGIQADVSREADARRIVDTAVERFGGLDILFNNAGIDIEGTLTEATEEDLQRQLDVNLKGGFFCAKYAVPAMLQRGGGSIINNASINGIRGNTNLVAYSASKGGVVAMTRALAIDYAASNIRVNCVCPASVEGTRMLESGFARSADPEGRRRALMSKHPMGRFARPEDIAYAVLFLASDESAFITGITLPIDGGRSVR